jgi:hypothetical protein
MGKHMSRTVLVALNVCAAAGYVLIGWRTAYLAHIDPTIFSTPDSHNYREVADWIFGARPTADASIWRPFFYPLLIGIAVRLGGTVGIWLLNVALWFTALNASWLATYRFTRSRWAASAVFLVLASNISLILLTFHALTEITSLALIAIWMVALERFGNLKGPMAIVPMLLPLSLLTLVKPEFEILLAITAGLLLVRSFSSTDRVRNIAALAASLVPIGIQVGLMVRVNHYWGVSEVGDSTVRGYYMARLLADIGAAPDVYGGRELTTTMSYSTMAQLLAAHPLRAVLTFGSILKGNLLSGSVFLSASDNHVLASIDTMVNKIYAVVLVPVMAVVAAALWRYRDVRLALLCVGALNVFTTGGLSFWQGDRLTIIALPLWLTALALAARRLFDWAREARASTASELGTQPEAHRLI